MEADYIVLRDQPIKQKEIETLRTAVGWDKQEGKYDKILEHSYTHYSVHDDSQLIGFINIISDGIGDAFLVNLMVHPKFQSKGIGTALVKTAIFDIKSDGVKFIQVIFDPEIETFFKKFGFHVVKAGVIDNETMDVDLQIT